MTINFGSRTQNAKRKRANWAILTTVQPVQEDDLRSLWEIKKKKKTEEGPLPPTADTAPSPSLLYFLAPPAPRGDRDRNTTVFHGVVTCMESSTFVLGRDTMLEKERIRQGLFSNNRDESTLPFTL
ncbi:hypothetical protein OUZ56_008066 [Daphnia magna]|uniref:Uncharacterized protein n=1 Tax=Daphnia magna TaxID=35525 RepID=A0ABR0ABW5_9CRUS|nr:hypothetical protein OUZ56_008066 [Daphnia magna]